MDVEYIQRGVVSFTITHTTNPLIQGFAIPQPNPKMHPPITTPAAHMYYGIKVHPHCVHPQHIKMLKHFVYTQYGCGIK